MFRGKEKAQVRSAGFEIFRNERRPDTIKEYRAWYFRARKIAENRGKSRRNAKERAQIFFVSTIPFLLLCFFFFLFSLVAEFRENVPRC